VKVFALFGRPSFLRRFHGTATVIWLFLAIPSVLWWKTSIPYLVFLSVYAAVMGHWSSWQSARVEVRQDEQINGAQPQTPRLDNPDMLP
jgi:type VI protein secretion system component VasK